MEIQRAEIRARLRLFAAVGVGAAVLGLVTFHYLTAQVTGLGTAFTAKPWLAGLAGSTILSLVGIPAREIFERRRILAGIEKLRTAYGVLGEPPDREFLEMLDSSLKDMLTRSMLV